MEKVSFTAMVDGSEADYRLLERFERQHVDRLPERILRALQGLSESLEGYQVTRLEHSLQTACRAEDDGADIEWVVAALIHDLGDDLAPMNHAQFAASMIRPYVRPEVTWAVEQHGLFQRYYYAHHLGQDPNGRALYQDHPYFHACVNFCERWDQASFDPAYPTRPLTHFAPKVVEVFSRPPFDASFGAQP
ncbi:MAG: HD domain-containing protein [Pseudomonadales bacterium]